MLLRFVIFLIPTLLSSVVFAAEPAKSVQFPLVQVKEFQPTVCEKILGDDLAVREEWSDKLRDLDMNDKGELGALAFASALCDKSPFVTVVDGKKREGDCQELKNKPEVQAILRKYFKPCAPQAAVEAANAWMKGEAGKVKILSVQSVKRKSGKHGETDFILVTYEAPASPPSVADSNKK